ncbi:MAG: amino acid decarboxylase [Faecousia sp.]
MNTPILDFVSHYSESQPLRLHMPGHKGRKGLGPESADITEIPGADVLYHPTGIILESEQNAAGLFGTGRTVYSTEGSSLPIRAMVYLTVLYAARNGRRPLIAAGRNAHKVFITAAALLDVDVVWLYPEGEGNLLSCEITPEGLESFLNTARERPTAVYITSPDYLGNLADVAGLSRICRKYGCLLLVDNAHGAYLNFLEESRHPMALGADLCCDSAHKTLPVLTGGAYLHISKSAPDLFSRTADQAMALFASTSPSYLILQSLDAANAAIASGWAERLRRAAGEWEQVKGRLRCDGYLLTGQEPLKLTILPKAYGYTGDSLAGILEEQGIFCEFSDPDHLVLMLPAEYDRSLPERLTKALLSIPRRDAITIPAPVLHRAEAVLRPHAALFRPSQVIRAAEASGRIMADPAVSCPPAIPVVCSGERIEPWAAAAMEYYGITHIRVILEDEVRL